MASIGMLPVMIVLTILMDSLDQAKKIAMGCKFKYDKDTVLILKRASISDDVWVVEFLQDFDLSSNSSLFAMLTLGSYFL